MRAAQLVPWALCIGLLAGCSGGGGGSFFGTPGPDPIRALLTPTGPKSLSGTIDLQSDPSGAQATTSLGGPGCQTPCHGGDGGGAVHRDVLAPGLRAEHRFGANQARRTRRLQSDVPAQPGDRPACSLRRTAEAEADGPGEEAGGETMNVARSRVQAALIRKRTRFDFDYCWLATRPGLLQHDH